MRLRKISIVISIALFILVALSFSACKQSKLTITKPAQDISFMDALGNVQDGNYNKDGTYINIKNNGSSISITDSEGSESNYEKTGTIGESGKVGVYENTDSSSTNNKKNMLVMGTDSSTIMVPASEKGTAAVKEAFAEFGEDMSINMIMDSQKPEYQKSDGSIDTDALAEKYKMTTEQKNKFNDIFKNVTKDDFGDSKTYNKTS